MKIQRLPVMLTLATVALLLAAGCAPQKIQRVESGQQIDLSGKWNDTDSRLLSEESINDAMTFPWIANFQKAKGRNPVVMAFGVKNRSTEIINTRTFVNDLTRAFIRSGRVDVVAEKEQRADLRGEMAEQQSGFTANPAQVGKEMGADFVLTGEINAIPDRDQDQELMFYQANLELIRVETTQIVWQGDKKIKKLIPRGKTRF